MFTSVDVSERYIKTERHMYRRFMENPRFGMDGWMRTHHSKEHKYRLGVDLTPDDEIRCSNCGHNLVQHV